MIVYVHSALEKMTDYYFVKKNDFSGHGVQAKKH